jgi:ABC-type branched-subunit amino acid transport system substrate-binding protein
MPHTKSHTCLPRLLVLSLSLLFLTACAVFRTELPLRIALLAPFEGRYREVGYNAYYAMRLAFADAGLNVEFLPVDDGGSMSTAVERAQALVLDPQVHIALLMGYAATAAETLQAFGDVPLLVVGHWSAQPTRDGVFMLASVELDALITVPFAAVTDPIPDTPISGGEVFALAQFPLLHESLAGITIVSSARLPDAAFRARYLASAEFAPEPGLLAMLAYDAARLTLQAVEGSATRTEVAQHLANMTYEGLNGTIRFEDGYWANAPIHTYAYDANRQLIEPQP